MRKALFIAIVLLIFSCLAIYFLVVTEKKNEIEPIGLVPVNASFIVKVNDFGSFLRSEEGKSKAFSHLLNQTTDPSLKTGLDFLMQIEKATGSNNPKPLLIAVYSSKNNLDWFFALGNIKPGIDIRNMVVNKSGAPIRTFNQTDIAILDQLPGSNWAIAFFNQTFVIASNDLLIEKAILQYTEGQSLLSDSTFVSLYKTSGKNVIGNIFVNYPKAFQFTGDLPDKLKPGFLLAGNFAKWGGFDINYRNETILLTGFSVADSPKQWAGLFNHQKSSKSELVKIIPESTAFYWSYNLNHFPSFKKSFENYTSSNNTNVFYKELEKTTRSFYSSSINDILLSGLDNEIAGLSCRFDEFPGQLANFQLIKLDKALETWTELKKVFMEASQLQNQKLYEETIGFEENTANLISIPLPGFHKMFNPIHPDFVEGKYLFLCADYLVFCDSVYFAQRFFDCYQQQLTLSTNLSSGTFIDQMSQSSGFRWFFNPSRYFPSLRYSKSNDLCGFCEFLKGFGYFGLELIPEKPAMPFTNFLVQMPLDDNKTENYNWQVKLDTNLAGKPKIVKNHLTKEDEIIVRDAGNTIYLFQKNGQLIWKKKINETILSDIEQIDLFKNRKFQFVFNTSQQLWIIDRNGKTVDPFPIRFKKPANAAIKIVDYEKSREYRFFIPCRNSFVLYDKKGKEVKDWNPKITGSKILSQIEHFNIKKQDYLVYADSQQVNFLDRRGKSRLKPCKGNIPGTNFKVFYSNEKSNEHFIYTDKNGTIRFLYLNGKCDSLNLGQFSDKHHFMHANWDGKAGKEYIFIDNDNIKVYSGKNLIYTNQLPGTTDLEPILFSLPRNENGFGLVFPEQNQLLLFSKAGNIPASFPLNGDSYFTIYFQGVGKLMGYQVICGSKNALINYPVSLQ